MKIPKCLLCFHENRSVYYAAGGLFLAILALHLVILFFWPAFDETVSGRIRGYRGVAFATAMDFVNWWGMSYTMVLSVFAAAAALFAASLRREALFVLGALPADAVNVLLKLLFRRERPQEMDIFPSFQQMSFPSGHVVHYVVFFGAILTVMIVKRRLPSPLRWAVGALCVFLILGVSVSRVYFGAHWPTDVLAADAVGFLLLAVLIRWYFSKEETRVLR